MHKILIANRGEIACRIMRTARRMGIATVAIYSDADRDALHVRQADEAVWVGPAPSADSYLNVDAILAAIEQTGADGVHPGYGFLSENAAFCETIQARGITFIGPGAGAIRAMGDKIASKKLAMAAGVATIPGHPEAVLSVEEAIRVARQIGYPVMIKASAGGGGKGMRIARTDQEVAEGWSSAANEGRAYFNDGRVFLEKYIATHRHIEVQVLCDTHGNGVWLHERDCSIQRRNQKVIEEAPSPFVDQAMRARMGEQALVLARSVGYVSAGTVEFMVGDDQEFYFLEMNTRLQVEHPVTEWITGLDLVEQMIRIARGERLSFAQADVGLQGWAMECRIYAENPAAHFLPSAGRLVHYQPPLANEWVRVDSGAFAGGEVSLFYDPMIAKLITWGATRAEAIITMRQALDHYFIDGPHHNIDFLSTLLRHPRFQAGDISTGFIAETYPDGFVGTPLSVGEIHFFALVAARIEMVQESLLAPVPDPCEWVVTVDTETVRLTVVHSVGMELITLDDGTDYQVCDDYQPGMRVATFVVDGQPRTVRVWILNGEGYRLAHDGWRVQAVVRPPRLHALAQQMPARPPPALSGQLHSPMPGLVCQVLVESGQAVRQGDALCVLEAMKMKNTLHAEKAGVVTTVHVRVGETVESDAVLFTFA
ncbi:MAG: acetyl/propionyl/methylcrotonyl-CoA carboxylase subunit alpha [Magnetococcales bacterium]|nr:acetyl/propionyl/methylcrotonyl-CoA carboxylase subunit alpha [Magnetococcales bacterium]